MNLRKLFNNRIFRTFLQTLISSIAAYLASTQISEINADAIVLMFVVGVSTALSSIMPLLEEEKE